METVNQHLPILMLSLGVSLFLVVSFAFIKAGGNPAKVLPILMAWSKKYWVIFFAMAGGLFAGLAIYAKREQADRVSVKKKALNDVSADVRNKIDHATVEADVKIRVARKSTATEKARLKRVLKTKDPDEKRKKLANMLVILMCVTLFVSCATRGDTEFMSALPKPLNVESIIEDSQEEPELVIEVADIECEYDKMVIPPGVLETSEGGRIEIPGGILISDCKATELISYRTMAKQLYIERNQLALVYDSLYKGCSTIEHTLHTELEENMAPSLWETIDFEVGFASGALACGGILYATAPAFDD